MTNPRFLHASLAVALLVSLTCTGCLHKPDTTETTETTQVVLVEPSLTEDSETTTAADGAEVGDPNIDIPWQSDDSSVQVNGGQTSLLATDFRVGVHDDYYRVVVEFVGEGDPGWTIAWVEEAVEIGRGQPLPIPQGHVLDVMIHGANWPSVKGSEDYYYNGPADKRLDDQMLAWFDGAFEADTHVAISSDKERPYRAFVLHSPTRLVIDLKK